MTWQKPLPQKIIVKMTTRETNKYEKLTKEWIKAINDADKAQADEVIYGRKLPKEPTKAQLAKEQKLINAGFKAGYILHKKSGEYHDYKKKMMRKYT